MAKAASKPPADYRSSSARDHEARRQHWAAVHLAADRRRPFAYHEPQKPFWIPEWTVRELMRGGDHG